LPHFIQADILTTYCKFLNNAVSLILTGI